MSSNKTPYQGKSRTWGEFRCEDCNRHWSSGNSWANCGQKCQSCDQMVYPYEQRPLKKANEEDGVNEGPHPKELCEKCMKLGRPCTEKRF